MWLGYRYNTSYLITVATESHSDILGLNNSKLENTSLSRKPDILTPFLLCLCYIYHRFRMIKKPMYFPRSWFTGSSYIRNYDLFHKTTEQNYTDGIHFLFPEVTSTESYMLWSPHQRGHWSILAKRPLILVLVSARTFRDSYLMCFSYLFPIE